VDVSWLRWRWCFFVGVPIALVAFLVLRKTLRLPTVRRPDVQVDYAGAALIAAGASVLLILMSFVDSLFDWISWQTAAMAGGGLVLLVIATIVESRVREPVVPPRIIRARTAALAIVGDGQTSALNLAALPPQIQRVVRQVYGDATAHTFLIAAAAALVGVVAVLP
jgi:MFS family permease